MNAAIESLYLWPKLKPYLRIEEYKREGGEYNPRCRIEFNAMPRELMEESLACLNTCVACDALIQVIRMRKGSGCHLYYAPSCALKDNIACSRGRAVRVEYRAVVEMMKGIDNSSQMRLLT